MQEALQDNPIGVELTSQGIVLLRSPHERRMSNARRLYTVGRVVVFSILDLSSAP